MTKPGRNDPCPCGSNKKWKKCCALVPVKRSPQDRVRLAILGQVPPYGGGSKVARSLQAAVTKEADAVFAEALAGGPKVACGPGCTWCCSFRVGTHGFEVVAIADQIRKTWEPAAFAALIERLRSNVAVVGHLDAAAHAEAKVPCALLDPTAKRCSIYEHRPLTCRSAASPDAEICRISLESDQNPPDACPTAVRDAEMGILFGLVEGMHEQDIDVTFGPPPVFELQGALLTALENSEIGDAWLSGEEPFEESPL